MEEKVYRIAVISICAILILECTAMIMGYNGTVLAAAIGGICAVSGYVAKTFQIKIKKG